ncbi:hypothetical protein [Pseudohoeflea coraliihabitans]|uniref:Uncharacterized protein n=1 Tax=Pseudohoeflea coraliihabitans TaxID=2860393 RepID=A0ABS6WLK7_9HYPH|nr:hypothetical protein [Pseudohoeflea sp. DP4N28-3]MBW3096827.1 hypothetical protein [Pseudohoeflea sp. DP4N28-3]
MNKTDAYVHETPGGAYYAMVRLPRHAKAMPILGKGGRPVRFHDAYSAMRAATQAVLAYFNGHLVRDGETLSATRDAAEQLFRRAG